MSSTLSPRRLVAVALCAGTLAALPATAPAVAASGGSAPAAVVVSAAAPQAHAAYRSKKYCDRLYKKLRKTNSPKVAKFLATLRGCRFKTAKKSSP
jgi:hypothetical protein